MGRPIYNYELSDPDFSWLVTNFKENNPNHTIVDTSGVPISFINAEKSTKIKEVTEVTPEEFESEIEPVIKDGQDIAGENK